MKFSSNMEFMLATLGFACGFGSVWRFPYCNDIVNDYLVVFKNGGGAFLIPYLILLMILAIPIFFLEIGVG
jgi:SNF family Na+-dependent transporter